MSNLQVGEISNLEAADQQLLLNLNNEHQIETSLLTTHEWQSLIENAFAATSISTDALLIAFDPSANYDNANFNWFSRHYSQFVYVDRIIISPKLRGTGAGQILYHHLFERAAAAGFERVACEINISPPNPVSDAFHKKLEFEEVGTATLSDRGKTVRYLLKDL